MRPEIRQEQCGFIKDTGTRNAQNDIRKAIYIQKEIYLGFIDYAKAFNKVCHKQLFELLGRLDLFGKNIRTIQNL